MQLTPEELAYARGLDDGRKEAANIPPDSIMLPGGRVVKVRGTLPMTADGCVLGVGIAYYEETPDEADQVAMCYLDRNSGVWNEMMPSATWYSTRAAAEAAKEATKL